MTITVQQLTQNLQVGKAQGMPPQQALAAFSSADLSTLGAVVLTRVLLDVYGKRLTPLKIARILRQLGYPAADISLALHSSYDSLNALSCGQILLDAQVWPQLPQADMQTALNSGQYSAIDSLQATNVLYPLTVSVAANQAWQSTGLVVTGNQKTDVNYISGMWSFNPQLPSCDASGNPSYRAKPFYTLPGQPEGALIGKLGDTMFLIGRQLTLPIGMAGTLALSINDDLDARYGAGLRDNSGSLSIRIVTS